MEEEQRYEQVRLGVRHVEVRVDPRIARSKQYALTEIMAMALSAVWSEAESVYDIAAFGETKKT